MLTRTILILVSVLPYRSLSQNYPFLKAVDIASTVSYDTSKSLYSYSYTLESAKSNVGSIQKLEMDISRGPNTLNLDTTGLTFDSEFELNNFRERYAQLSSKTVSIGIPVLPGREWVGMLTNRYTVSISADSAFIKPGGIVKSIVITSRGLPSIRVCVISPNFQDDLLFPSIEDTSANAMTIAQMDSIRDAVNYHGWTIGPTAPPVNFTSATWLDTLISYKHQALNLGWIDNQGIVNSLDQKLDNAKSQLQKGDTAAAKNTLRALVNEVEAQNGKHLTSEAYALLRYNTEYLISKLH